MMISIRDKNEMELKCMTFTNREEMAEKLSDFAQTNDSEISYVDIYFPVPLLQVHILIFFFTIKNSTYFRKNKITNDLVTNNLN